MFIRLQALAGVLLASRVIGSIKHKKNLYQHSRGIGKSVSGLSGVKAASKIDKGEGQ